MRMTHCRLGIHYSAVRSAVHCLHSHQLHGDWGGSSQYQKCCGYTYDIESLFDLTRISFFFFPNQPQWARSLFRKYACLYYKQMLYSFDIKKKRRYLFYFYFYFLFFCLPYSWWIGKSTHTIVNCQMRILNSRFECRGLDDSDNACNETASLRSCAQFFPFAQAMGCGFKLVITNE